MGVFKKGDFIWPVARRFGRNDCCDNGCGRVIGDVFIIAVHDGLEDANANDDDIQRSCSFICPLCLAQSLGKRNHRYPAAGGRCFSRYVYVEPGRARGGDSNCRHAHEEVVIPPIQYHPSLDAVRLFQKQVVKDQAEEGENEPTLNRMQITTAFAKGSGDFMSFSYYLDASPDGWKNTSQPDVDNMCATARILSPYLMGLNAHLTPPVVPVQSPRELLLYGLQEDSRPASQFLFSLLTGELTWDDDKIKINADYASQWWSAFAASEIMTRARLQRPSYLQAMMGDVLSTQDLDRNTVNLLSMMNISQNGSFSHKEMAMVALQNVMDHTEKPQSAVHILGGDNCGLRKKKDYQQWTILQLL